MPKINIEAQSSHDINQSLERVKTLFADDQDLRKIDPHYTVSFDDRSYSGLIKGSKFEAKIEVREKLVTVQVDIPLMLSPFKGQIKSGLEKKLEKALS